MICLYFYFLFCYNTLHTMNKSIKKSKALYNPKIVKNTTWDIIPNIFLFSAGFFFFILILFHFFTYSYFIVKNSSMIPTLNNNSNGLNDAVYVNRYASVEVGDIVVVKNHQSYSVIKRIIGFGGDKIGFVTKLNDDNEVVRKLVRIPNGLQTYYEFDEYYLENDKVNEYAFERFQSLIAKSNNVEIIDGIDFYVIGENEIFYLGDNRVSSFDCLNYGSVDEKLLVGKVELIVKEQKFFLIQYLLFLFGINKI